jgi:hypothetical protein
MGRPVKKIYFGNVSLSTEAILGNAWVNGDTVGRPSYIYKQLTSNSYQWLAVGDTNNIGTPQQCYLVNGPLTGPGQANIAIYPYGAEGGGATAANANLLVASASTITNGDGNLSGHNYVVGSRMQVIGGTYTGAAANVLIAATTWNAVGVANAGTSYVIGDQLTFSFAGWQTPAVLQVGNINATGAITALSINNSGIYTANSIPGSPFAASSNTSVAGKNATVNVQFGVYSFGAVANGGDYTVLPSNPVSFNYLGTGGGAGATANLLYGVSSVQVTNGGSGFQPGSTASVTFSTGNASAVGVINAAGSISSVTITNAGNNYSARPTVTIAPSAAPSLAQQVFGNTVRNFQGQTWSWLPNGYLLPNATWANLNTL